MITQKHLIKRFVLELTVADSGEAYQLQEEVSRICRRRLVPIIDEHCSAVSAPDRIDRIDSLEIDLGTLDHANRQRSGTSALFQRLFLFGIENDWASNPHAGNLFIVETSPA